MEFRYTCSLGTLCQSSQILKNNNLKMSSYPFDWIFSNPDNVIHAIEDDFKIFLDKSYYKSISEDKCGHSYYHNNMFNHHNPLINENHYNYYVRCVNRFKDLLKKKEPKIFIITFPNRDELDETCKNNIIEFNNKFSKYTDNYKLLVIFHIPNKKVNYHSFTYYDNIDFLEIHTLSKCSGTGYFSVKDDNYLNDIIINTYKFNLVSFHRQYNNIETLNRNRLIMNVLNKLNQNI